MKRVLVGPVCALLLAIFCVLGTFSACSTEVGAPSPQNQQVTGRTATLSTSAEAAGLSDEAAIARCDFISLLSVGSCPTYGLVCTPEEGVTGIQLSWLGTEDGPCTRGPKDITGSVAIVRDSKGLFVVTFYDYQVGPRYITGDMVIEF